MPETGSFFDIDPENWKEYVDLSEESDSIIQSGVNTPTKKTRKQPVVADPDADFRPYWQVQLELVNAWADYQKVKHLLINASYDETRHVVAPVVKKYWNNNKVLKRRVDERSAEVDMAIQKANLVSGRFGIEPISRDWLYRNLEEASDYSSYRGKIKRRLARNKPAKSLKAL